MLNKKTKTEARQITYDIVIGSNSTVEGELSSKGSVRIDGTVIGNITAEGDITIGPEAVITGDINSSNVELSGTVNGNITADGYLKVYETGKLHGDINVNSFIISEGGTFKGFCEINPKDSTESTADEIHLEEAQSVNSSKSNRRNRRNKNNTQQDTPDEEKAS